MIYRLIEMDDGIFYLLLEQNEANIQQNYFSTLENLNRFAR